MKIRIKFDADDATDISKAEFQGSCETSEELARTLFTLIGLTNLNYERVMAELLGYSTDSLRLTKAIAILEGTDRVGHA